MSAPDMERISAALFSIPPDDRDLWVRMGMAIKSELGDEGFEIWSRQSDRYNERAARDSWRSFKPNGGIGAGTLFREAASYGWRDNGRYQKPTPEELEARRREAAERSAKEEAEKVRKHADAARKAAEILEGATGDPATHPYAVKKQIPFGPLVKRGAWPQRGWPDALLVPIYGADEGLRSIGAISTDGDKNFLKGGRMAGGFYPFGKVSGADRVLIGEGISTVAACVAADPSPAAAALCSGNLRAVAEAVRELAPGADIILLADFDVKPDGSNPGLNAAREAAREVRGRIATPELDGRACDMWDVWAEGGVEAVRRVIAGAKAPDTESTAEDLDATVRRLAALSPIAYDKVRLDEAVRLGVRVTTLDVEVEKARRQLAGDSAGDGQGDAILFPDIEPWPEPVDGAELLTDLADTCRCYAVLPKFGDVAISLWAIFSHSIDAVSIAPYLSITSPEKRCGKSTILALIARLVPRSLPASNISPAALFRAIEAWAPTLLIDEADSFVRNSEELRGILNSGHTRGLAFVIRTVGDDHEPRRFSTWAAKVICLIGKLPDTLADRSIEIPLKRKLPSESVEKLRHADPELFINLARRCARWATDHVDEIRAARPPMPDALNDRAQDSWEPLLAIADLAGGPWPKQAREAALALSGAVDVEGEGVQLLADIRAVLNGSDLKDSDRISSDDLTTRLVALEERPWSEHSRGKPLTKTKLAHLLRPFKVVSGSVRLPDGTTPKGYLFDQFTDAFKRYLPPLDTPSHGDPPFKAQQRHKQGWARVSEDFGNATPDGRGVSENGPEPSCGAGCGGVADSNPRWGEGGAPRDWLAMSTQRGRPSTPPEILGDLAAAGRPVTVQAALMVMVDEMNDYLGIDIKATPRPMPEQTDAERRRDIEETLALFDKAGRWAARNRP